MKLVTEWKSWRTESHRFVEVVTSPAAEALEFLTMEGGAQVQSGPDTIDPQNLLIDLNDLLRYGHLRNRIPFLLPCKENP